ncbi:hypothetical protein BSLA_02f2624 [Burkholderia stabilis]|nr:hypothetical protein BSLA_02f2624 [Burkholderia stabilis]
MHHRLALARLQRRDMEPLLQQQHIAVPREHRPVDAAVPLLHLLQRPTAERVVREAHAQLRSHRPRNGNRATLLRLDPIDLIRRRWLRITIGSFEPVRRVVFVQPRRPDRLHLPYQVPVCVMRVARAIQFRQHVPHALRQRPRPVDQRPQFVRQPLAPLELRRRHPLARVRFRPRAILRDDPRHPRRQRLERFLARARRDLLRIHRIARRIEREHFLQVRRRRLQQAPRRVVCVVRRPARTILDARELPRRVVPEFTSGDPVGRPRVRIATHDHSFEPTGRIVFARLFEGAASSGDTVVTFTGTPDTPGVITTIARPRSD